MLETDQSDKKKKSCVVKDITGIADAHVSTIHTKRSKRTK